MLPVRQATQEDVQKARDLAREYGFDEAKVAELETELANKESSFVDTQVQAFKVEYRKLLESIPIESALIEDYVELGVFMQRAPAYLDGKNEPELRDLRDQSKQIRKTFASLTRIRPREFDGHLDRLAEITRHSTTKLDQLDLDQTWHTLYLRPLRQNVRDPDGYGELLRRFVGDERFQESARKADFGRVVKGSRSLEECLNTRPVPQDVVEG